MAGGGRYERGFKEVRQKKRAHSCFATLFSRSMPRRSAVVVLVLLAHTYGTIVPQSRSPKVCPKPAAQMRFQNGRILSFFASQLPLFGCL
eukprot:4169070-Amphidinium_carterae.1